MRPLSTHAFVLLAVLMPLASCVFQPTEVLCAIATDVPASTPLTVLVSAALSAADDGAAWSHGWQTGVDGSNVITLPASFAVVAPPGQGDAVVTIVVEAIGPTFTLRRIARVQMVPNQTIEMPIYLARTCANLTSGCSSLPPDLCTVEQYCEDRGESCGPQGGCVAIDQTPIDAGASSDASDIVSTSDAPTLMDVPSSDASACGALGEPCCDPAACGPGTMCAGGVCVCAGDICGGACCAPGDVCTGGACCAPNCGGSQCGDDGCGGSCGTCPAGFACDAPGNCVCPSGVLCGGDCCTDGQECNGGACCTPNCAGRSCGDDGCGGSCGSPCATGASCNPSGTCCDDLQTDCGSASDCCGTASCRPYGSGSPNVCCNEAGASCGSGLDCCGTMTCGGTGTCVCQGVTNPCDRDPDCCSGFVCSGYVCCVPLDQTCANATHCCGGASCRPYVAGSGNVCCHEAGHACSTAIDCCGQMQCRSGACACQAVGAGCTTTADCCAGHTCQSGTCH